MTSIDMTIPGNRRQIALLVLRSRTRLEIKTGMPFSNRGPSYIQAARDWGYEGKQTRAAVLAWLDLELEGIAL